MEFKVPNIQFKKYYDECEKDNKNSKELTHRIMWFTINTIATSTDRKEIRFFLFK